jgi:hypothetical protein
MTVLDQPQWVSVALPVALLTDRCLDGLTVSVIGHRLRWRACQKPLRKTRGQLRFLSASFLCRLGPHTSEPHQELCRDAEIFGQDGRLHLQSSERRGANINALCDRWRAHKSDSFFKNGVMILAQPNQGTAPLGAALFLWVMRNAPRATMFC